MKHFFVILSLMLIAVLPASAQYADLYYHRVGDTVEQNPNNGYFTWWEWDRSLETTELIAIQYQHPHVISLMKFYTPTPLKILGLAAVVDAVDRSGFHVPQTSRQEYLYLYEADASGVHRLKAEPYNVADTHRFLHLTFNMMHVGGGTNYSCCQENLREFTFPLYEYYFDSAITVYDSFYVGGSGNSRNCDQHYDDDYIAVYMEAYFGMPVNVTDCKNIETGWPMPCSFDTVTFLTGQTGSADITDTLWTYYPAIRRVTLIYPIVEMDTTLPPADMCVGVEGIQASLSGDCLTISWDHWPRYTSVQLRYGPITVAQSEWDTIEVSSGATHTLCGLDTTVSHYGISLRAYCASADDTTDWSQLIWFPMEQTPGAAIDGPQTPLSASVALSPNPASGTVHVSSHHLLRRIEMVNARGITVYSEPASGHEASVSLDRLPAGLYLVSVQTSSGTATQRLVVE